MPTYEFKCSKCDEAFVEIQTIDDCGVVPACPKCKSADNVKKKWFSVPFEFDGAKKYGIKR
jgi:putative FmdB family regulatory protein